jgi:sugar phosphate isomerase/epimerase
MEERLPQTLWLEELGHPLPSPNNRWATRRIHGYWAWSADAPFPSDRRYQSPIFQCTQGTLSIDYGACQAEIEMLKQTPLEIRKPEPLEVGAITSYEVGSISKALEGLAYYKVPTIDLFLFQAEDLRKYYSVPRDAEPLLVVSSAHIRPEAIAAKIAGDVDRARGRCPFVVRGIATYFPEISSLNPQKRLAAVRALQNIIRLAGVLQSSRYGHEHGFQTRFVEIVAGTRVSGFRMEKRQDLRAGVSEPTDVAKATLASFYHKLYVLLQSLQVLAKTAHEHGVYLAIEVEPGLLPFISEFAHVESLVKAVASDPGFVKTLEKALHHPFPHIAHRDHVGLNVDVAHMRLCGIGPQQLRKDLILNRICHVHIGDIGPGHLCDLVIGSVNSFEGYREWFELFHDAANGLPRLGPYPDFSCCLSVELEACRDRKMIGAAYHRTRLLLRKYYEQRSQMSRNAVQAGSR